MCDPLAPANDLDASAGTLYRLCDLAVAHVMELAGVQLPPAKGPAPDTARPFVALSYELEERGQARTSVPTRSGPGARLYASFCEEAKTLLIETQYFDLDRRSEIAELQEHAFEPFQMSSLRLHFFSIEATDGESLRDFVQRAAVEARGREDGPDNTETERDEAAEGELVLPVRPPVYLGYSIVQGQDGAPIGRTLVSPYASATSADGKVRVDAQAVFSQVRTAVTEHVSVYGVTLVATGIPFMEQDGALLRCGHVSAWMCHYTAVLRGFVPRRPVAHFHREGGTYATGRSFPSSGVTTFEIAQMLARSDMPPELLDAAALTKPRTLNWTDRQIHHQRFGSEPAEVPGVPEESSRRAAQQRRRQWIAENLGASICRYLNSGLPSIVLRADEDHTVVVVGYLRRSDFEAAGEGTAQIDLHEIPTSDEEDLADLLSPAAPNSAHVDAQSDVVYLIVADDQRGPFELLSLESLAESVDTDDSKVMVPLPHGLALTGQTAERTAIRLMGLYVDICARPIRAEGFPAELRESALLQFSEDLATADSQVSRLADPATPSSGSQKYTIRTYVTTGVDLKAGVSRRLGERFPDLATALTMQALPKFVWVLEVIDRKRRRARKRDTVRALLVLDASQVISGSLDDETLKVTVRPMFIHIPGSSLVYAVKPIPGSVWVRDTFQAYSTGRWDHNQLTKGAAERVAIHGKGAVAVKG
ncbi:hypothetical protein [Microbacterium sp. A1-JK]|uniref:hypothetical protein n=1 Tax=Microbacterium sp. A1-JK TaxID=3177516 RepID=UPI003883A9E2